MNESTVNDVPVNELPVSEVVLNEHAVDERAVDSPTDADRVVGETAPRRARRSPASPGATRPSAGASEPANVVLLRGWVSSEPLMRHASGGGSVLSFELRSSVSGSGTVPVAWAEPGSYTMAVGDEVRVVGAVRRRFFRVGGATQSRTEVVAAHVCRVSDRRGSKLLLSAVETLLQQWRALTTGG